MLGGQFTLVTLPGGEGWKPTSWFTGLHGGRASGRIFPYAAQ